MQCPSPLARRGSGVTFWRGLPARRFRLGQWRSTSRLSLLPACTSTQETVTPVPCDARLFSTRSRSHRISQRCTHVLHWSHQPCVADHVSWRPLAAAPSGLVPPLLPSGIASCSPTASSGQWQQAWCAISRLSRSHATDRDSLDATSGFPVQERTLSECSLGTLAGPNDMRD